MTGPVPLALLAAVAAGSALGAVLRHSAGLLQQRWLRDGHRPDAAALPWSTLSVNVVGSVLLGAVVGAGQAGLLGPVAVTTLGAGVAGGLTTFSTFAVEVVAMVRTGRRRTAIAWTLATLVLGVAGAAAGAGAVHLAAG